MDEDRDEIYYTNSEGEEVSYNPPRYKYSYDFTLRFKVNNPYFDDFSVKLNNFRVEGMGSMEYNKYQQMAVEAMNYLVPGRGVVPNMNNAGIGAMGMGAAAMGMGAVPNQGYAPYGQQPNMYQPQGGFAPQQGYAPQGGYVPQQNPYAQQPQQTGMYQQNGYAQPQPNTQQPAVWFCQSCGAQNNGGNFCQSCGTPKQ